jgi:DNA-binding beta-propeller fold protein YncE
MKRFKTASSFLLVTVLTYTIAVSAVPRAWAERLKFLAIDYENNSVLHYDGITGALRGVFVRSGSGGLNGPQNLIFGPDGNLYVSSHNTGSVLRYNGTTGAFIDAFVPAHSGGLANPDQLAFGPDGNLYVSARFTARIFRYDGQTGAFIDIPISDGRLGGFVGFTFGPDGKIYATEYNGHFDVLRCDLATRTCDVFASGQSIVSATGITFGPDGNLYVSGINSDNVIRYDGKTGAFIDVFVSVGSGGLRGADALSFGPDGNLYVSSIGSHQTLRYDGGTGAFIDDFSIVHGLGIPDGFDKGLAFFPTLPFAVATLSQARLAFQSRPMGTTSNPMTVMLTNTGQTAMTDYKIRVEFASEFTQTNDCPTTLKSMKNCIIHVTFTPSGLGTRAGTLRVAGVAGSKIGGIRTVNLRGTGQ